MQKHEIPYSTATWGIVEDALEPAPFLSVAAYRYVKSVSYTHLTLPTKCSV